MGKKKNNQHPIRAKISNYLGVTGFLLAVLSAVGLGLVVVVHWLSGFRSVDIPALTGRVVDNARVLTPDGAGRVEAEIKELESATAGGQMAVLTVPTTHGDAIEAFSLKVAEKWKIGQQGKDNGAVLVIAVNDHRDRLEIGRGWEGPIPDARAGDILRAMTPYLRANDYAGAAVLAVRQVRALVTGAAAGAIPEPMEGPEPSQGLAMLICMYGIIAGLVSVFAAALVDPSPAGKGKVGSGSGGSHGGGFSGGGGGCYSGGGGSFSGGGASGRW